MPGLIINYKSYLKSWIVRLQLHTETTEKLRSGAETDHLSYEKKAQYIAFLPDISSFSSGLLSLYERYGEQSRSISYFVTSMRL